jgi:hypothetical protein
MDPKSMNGNPQVFDKLKPGLVGKVIDLVRQDMERAKREKEEKKKQKKG